jgi:hypothetical protein
VAIRDTDDVVLLLTLRGATVATYGRCMKFPLWVCESELGRGFADHS